MERLSDTAIEIINDLHTERLEYASEYIPLIDAANCLTAYEDTGLTPEEINDMALEVATLKTIESMYDGLGKPDHIRDLLHAEQEGRLVVLPCGTDVELVRDGHAFKADHWNHTLTAFRDAPENKSGKQVALFSIKEAALALKGGESDA